MRGYMFEANSTPELFFGMEKSDFFNDLDQLHVEFVENAEPEQARAQLDWLRQLFANSGAELGEDVDPDTNEPIFWIRISDDTKRRFYESRFSYAKKLLSEMSLNVFSGVEHGSLGLLKSTIDDDYGCMVYLDESFYTLDDFVRYAIPDKKYTFSNNVVELH